MKRSTATSYHKVIRYLTDDGKYRDDDEALVARFWYDEMIALGVNMDVLVRPYEVMRLFVKGKLTKYDTITRLRRKAQEEYRVLRGSTYAERKLKKTDTAKQELKELELNRAAHGVHG